MYVQIEKYTYIKEVLKKIESMSPSKLIGGVMVGYI